MHLPLTQLVSIEDTANRGGGAVYEINEIEKIANFCRSNSLPLHLDGARVFNALAINQMNAASYGSYYNTISICLSKGLGAPVGSLLLGDKQFITKARRLRKVLGGGMRQAGIIAAGGLYALKNHVHRLKEDHFHAQMLGNCLSNLDWVKEVMPVETNIVVAILMDESLRDARIEELKSNGIQSIAFGPGMIRFVTHMDIGPNDIDFCIETLNKLK